MGYFSGKDGKVLAGASAVLDVTKWEFNDEANTTRFASSSTGGYKASEPGTLQGDGSVEAKVQDGVPYQLRSGMKVTLNLYEDDGAFWVVPATIKSCKRSCDIDSGEVLGYTASFENNGAWTEPVRP